MQTVLSMYHNYCPAAVHQQNNESLQWFIGARRRDGQTVQKKFERSCFSWFINFKILGEVWRCDFVSMLWLATNGNQICSILKEIQYQ